MKLLSSFSITGNSDSPDEIVDVPATGDGDDPFAGMDPAKASLAMQELQGAMEGMDDDNPDPRQMGSLMRRMSELTGERMDEPMEEVVRKLEEGSDPEELEANMGEMIGDEDLSEKNEQESIDDSKARLRNFLKANLSRDPLLYEFEEYLSS